MKKPVAGVLSVPECLKQSPQQCREVHLNAWAPIEWALPLYGFLMLILAVIWRTVQRYILVPKLVQSLCTIRRSKQMIVTICVVSLWIYAPELFASYNRSFSIVDTTTNRTRSMCVAHRTALIQLVEIPAALIFGMHVGAVALKFIFFQHRPFSRQSILLICCLLIGICTQSVGATFSDRDKEELVERVKADLSIFSFNLNLVFASLIFTALCLGVGFLAAAIPVSVTAYGNANELKRLAADIRRIKTDVKQMQLELAQFKVQLAKACADITLLHVDRIHYQGRSQPLRRSN